MAVNTAACFLIAGLALACASLLPRASGMWALFGGYFVLIISGSALTGYWPGPGNRLPLGGQTRMAILTAAGFVLLGGGLMKLGWRRIAVNRTLWLTLLSAGTVAGTSDAHLGRRGRGLSQDGRFAGGAGSDALYRDHTRVRRRNCRVSCGATAANAWCGPKALNTDLQDKVTERNAQLQRHLRRRQGRHLDPRR